MGRELSEFFVFSSSPCFGSLHSQKKGAGKGSHRVDELRVPGVHGPGPFRGAVLEDGKLLQDVVLDRGDVGGADPVLRRRPHKALRGVLILDARGVPAQGRVDGRELDQQPAVVALDPRPVPCFFYFYFCESSFLSRCRGKKNKCSREAPKKDKLKREKKLTGGGGARRKTAGTARAAGSCRAS